MTTLKILRATKAAEGDIKNLSTDKKNEIMMNMAKRLEEEQERILSENLKDLEAAKGKITEVMADRLKLDEKRIAAMADGIRQIAALPDPANEDIEKIVRPNGLIIHKRRVPLGLVAIIYESRPNVTSDAAALS